MKILLTADLHGHRPWYEWIAWRAAQFDLVCVAGDLLDASRLDGFADQMLAVEHWCRALPAPLAVCSGNHDGNDEPLSLDPDALGAEHDDDAQTILARMLMATRWMDVLAGDRVVTDGQSRVMSAGAGRVVLTSIPYGCGPAAAEDHWEHGAALRHAGRIPWIVLHHEPPAGTSVGGHFGDASLPWQLEAHRPDFLLSGHNHLQPYRGDFAQKIHGTWCFNAGQPGVEEARHAATPNHIILDLQARTAVWDAVPVKGKTRIRKAKKLA